MNRCTIASMTGVTDTLGLWSPCTITSMTSVTDTETMNMCTITSMSGVTDTLRLWSPCTIISMTGVTDTLGLWTGAPSPPWLVWLTHTDYEHVHHHLHDWCYWHTGTMKPMHHHLHDGCYCHWDYEHVHHHLHDWCYWHTETMNMCTITSMTGVTDAHRLWTGAPSPPWLALLTHWDYEAHAPSSPWLVLLPLRLWTGAPSSPWLVLLPLRLWTGAPSPPWLALLTLGLWTGAPSPPWLVWLTHTDYEHVHHHLHDWRDWHTQTMNLSPGQPPMGMVYQQGDGLSAGGWSISRGSTRPFNITDHQIHWTTHYIQWTIKYNKSSNTMDH